MKSGDTESQRMSSELFKLHSSDYTQTGLCCHFWRRRRERLRFKGVFEPPKHTFFKSFLLLRVLDLLCAMTSVYFFSKPWLLLSLYKLLLGLIHLHRILVTKKWVEEVEEKRRIRKHETIKRFDLSSPSSSSVVVSYGYSYGYSVDSSYSQGYSILKIERDVS